MVDADNIDYEFTVTDPATWVPPWKAEVPPKRERPIRCSSTRAARATTAWSTSCARSASKKREQRAAGLGRLDAAGRCGLSMAVADCRWLLFGLSGGSLA